jgi:hypothetical protein
MSRDLRRKQCPHRNRFDVRCICPCATWADAVKSRRRVQSEKEQTLMAYATLSVSSYNSFLSLWPGGVYVECRPRDRGEAHLEQPTPQAKLTPARVRRGFRNLHAKTASLACAPKPSRPGPGRPPGSRNRHRATTTTSGASSPPARPTAAPPTTRKAQNPAEQVKDQA